MPASINWTWTVDGGANSNAGILLALKSVSSSVPAVVATHLYASNEASCPFTPGTVNNTSSVDPPSSDTTTIVMFVFVFSPFGTDYTIAITDDVENNYPNPPIATAVSPDGTSVMSHK